MQAVQKKSSLVLGLIRCFNAAAFVALSAFYFGMFCLGKPAIDQVDLVPLAHAAAPHVAHAATKTVI